MRNIFRHISTGPSRLIALLITGYQHTLSPDHGPLKHLFPDGYCRHEPTCSQYAKQRILKDGVVLAAFPVIWRILSCNPWTPVSDAKLRAMAARRASQ